MDPPVGIRYDSRRALDPVYFITTRLLREAGLGPTLLVSPLLALMRNQTSWSAHAWRCCARVDTADPAALDSLLDGRPDTAPAPDLASLPRESPSDHERAVDHRAGDKPR